jgi:hypothetical protein
MDVCEFCDVSYPKESMYVHSLYCEKNQGFDCDKECQDCSQPYPPEITGENVPLCEQNQANIPGS